MFVSCWGTLLTTDNAQIFYLFKFIVIQLLLVKKPKYTDFFCITFQVIIQ